jgi:hypothetical protein
MLIYDKEKCFLMFHDESSLPTDSCLFHENLINELKVLELRYCEVNKESNIHIANCIANYQNECQNDNAEMFKNIPYCISHVVVI